MNLTRLAGNAPLKRQLGQQADARGLSHAYILAGPAGCGKKTLARLLGAALVCADPRDGAKPCLTCDHCRKALREIHPDIIRIGGDGKDVTVAQVRALRSDAYIRPNEAPRKVYLIENAQTMNPSAQNAMLKLLEEGPAYAAFLLLTDNAGALLPTVRSRCETLGLSPVTEAEAEEYLRGAFPAASAEAVTAAARRCQGILGRAVGELGGSESPRDQARAGAVTLLTRLSEGDERALLEYTVTLEKWDRDSLEALFDESILLLRDALVCACGGPSEEEDPLRRSAARLAAERLPAGALLAAIEALERLRAACTFNAGTGHLAGWLCAAMANTMQK